MTRMKVDQGMGCRSRPSLRGSLSRRAALLAALAAMPCERAIQGAMAVAVTTAACADPGPCEGVDLQSDAANCRVCGGRCDYSHGVGQCIRGECSLAACNAGFVRREIHAGAFVCDDLRTSAFNCGSPGHTCNTVGGLGERCVDGQCTCLADQVHCGQRCTTLDVDQENCGACGVRCGAAEACFDGRCRATSCPAGSMLVPGGLFVDEASFQPSRIAPFCLSRLEATFSQWEACVGAGRCDARRGGDYYQHLLRVAAELPVELERNPYQGSSGFVVGPASAAATRLCAHLGGRLPTQDEWFWAASGRAERRRYPWGDDAISCARGNVDYQHCQCRDAWNPWCCYPSMSSQMFQGCRIGVGGLENTPRSAVGAVGRHPAGASRDGIEDMLGNVSEIVVNCRESQEGVPHGGIRGCVPFGDGFGHAGPDANASIVSVGQDILRTGGDSHVGVRCAFDPR